jgi:hypothetical protein
MTAAFWLPLLIKALATGLLVVCASALAETLGAFWGGLIASLPVSTGPTYIFLSMQHDAGFVAASALGSFAANATTAVFLTLYGLLAGRLPLWKSLGLAVLAWLAISLGMQRIAWTPLTATALNLVAYGAGLMLLRRVPAAEARPRHAAGRRWFDLPVRAGAVALFVSCVVLISTLVGPAATGIIAVFPISLTSLFVILHPRIGGPASALLAVNAMRPMLGFGAMLLVLHLAIPVLGVPLALVVALMVSALWSVGLLVLRPRA